MEKAMTIANKRNQIVKIRTNFLLKQIDNERKLTERMHDTSVRYRFQAKFDNLSEKLSVRDLDPRISITSVTPSSRYRDIRSAPIYRSTRTIPESTNDEEDLLNYLENLLYTNREIDVEKLLCLQLIANHKIWSSPEESNTNISNNSTLISETVLNVTFNNEMSVSSNLHNLNPILETEKSLINETDSFPVYLIEFKELATDFEALNTPSHNSNDSDVGSIKTKKLNSICSYKTLVNFKLLKIINSVSNALKSASPIKSKIFLEKSKDPATLRELLRKTSSQTFINSLRNYLFIAKSSSYHVIEQNVLPVYLECEPSTHLEKFTFDIMDNIVQQVKNTNENNNTWKMQPSTTQIPLTENGTEQKAFQSKANVSHLGSLMKTTAKNAKSKYSIHTIASDLRRKFIVTQKREMENLQTNLKKNTPYHQTNEKITSSSFKEQQPAKPFSVRRSSCEACLQKYKLPHATPKTRTILRYKQNDPDFLFSKNISHTSTPMLTRLLKNADQIKKKQMNSLIIPILSPGQTPTYSERSSNKLTNKESLIMASMKTESFRFDVDATKEDHIFTNNFLVRLEKEIILRETEKRLQTFLESPL